ncbi:MAG: glycosyltransferase family 4 protein [Oscillospiraceae bacterium]|nr:glycosyltransferase family 4 protein [Oscillospiraceae bacterium]
MKFYIDLTNLLNVDFVTGIQRVAREITVRLLKNARHEWHLLYWQDNASIWMELDNAVFLRYFTGETEERGGIITQTPIRPKDIPSGAVFFDIDSVWNARLKRSYLFPQLRQRGVRIVTQLYDLIPITHPQYCHEATTANFILYTGANLRYADLIITNSQATVKALDALTDSLGLERKRSAVVPLSSDFSAASSAKSGREALAAVSEIAAKGKYLLMLGTVEPRKNHKLALDALEQGLAAEGMNLVIAGRIGWNVEALETRIRKHKLLGKQLFFVERPDDAEVDYLYKNAFAVAFPTFNEGFGLPVIEAFLRGTPVVASDIEVLHEVAGDYADYFDPNDPADFTRCVRELMQDESRYAQRREMLKSYHPRTWDDSAAMMMEALSSLEETKPSAQPQLRQMVCLTARNEDILATLPFIEHFMPFITELVLCCPDQNADEIRNRYHGRLTLRFLTDSEVLDGRKLPEDHGTRNFFLRALALKSPVMDDVFLMTDDDYRPLRTISPEVFVKDGVYQAYYCYDLKDWTGAYPELTSFDRQQHRTLAFLREHHYPTLMYASHQMQVIDKRIYNEMTERYADMTDKGLCEWAMYFNYAVANYPSRFNCIPYVTMGWPGSISDWNLWVQPSDLLFENHYSELYADGKVFDGLCEDFCEDIAEVNQQKILRFSRELQKQQEGLQVFAAYYAAYRYQYREDPSFFVTLTQQNELRVILPAYLTVKAGLIQRIPLQLDKRLRERFSGGLLLNYWFSNEEGEPLSVIGRMSAALDILSLRLPVAAPSAPQQCLFHLRVIPEGNGSAADSDVWAMIV